MVENEEIPAAEQGNSAKESSPTLNFLYFENTTMSVKTVPSNLTTDDKTHP